MLSPVESSSPNIPIEADIEKGMPNVTVCGTEKVSERFGPTQPPQEKNDPNGKLPVPPKNTSSSENEADAAAIAWAQPVSIRSHKGELLTLNTVALIAIRNRPYSASALASADDEAPQIANGAIGIGDEQGRFVTNPDAEDELLRLPSCVVVEELICDPPEPPRVKADAELDTESEIGHARARRAAIAAHNRARMRTSELSTTIT